MNVITDSGKIFRTLAFVETLTNAKKLQKSAIKSVSTLGVDTNATAIVDMK